MFGYSREELIGQNVSLLMPSPERDEHDGYLARYSQTRQPKIIGSGREVRGRRKDGTVFPLDLSVSETRLGDRCFFTGIVRDATLRHVRLKAEKELAATHEQLRLARSIQQGFFPRTSPVVPGYELGGASHPAEETGGDYFDYFPMPAGRIGIVVADVSGHGVGPALVMSQTRAYLHALLPLGLDVSELATRLNDFLISDDPDACFVTLFLAQLDPRDGSFVYASAGHQCFLLGPGDEVQSLDCYQHAAGHLARARTQRPPPDTPARPTGPVPDRWHRGNRVSAGRLLRDRTDAGCRAGESAPARRRDRRDAVPQRPQLRPGHAPAGRYHRRGLEGRSTTAAGRLGRGWNLRDGKTSWSPS